jgi:hypothetical protein
VSDLMHWYRTASQYTLSGAAVELFEDLRAHTKYFLPPEGKRRGHVFFMTVRVCVDHFKSWSHAWPRSRG